ncbi:hypothetical protein CDL10_07025 [Avrilella dinanensis]|uniref:Uncharacterized protein n=1 Tax=Avrilella dinanensis TaxID=2008672 RepID=A0A2M9R632_9FLAO|nr:hypothetical protein CDL10_07025 [Avrilella dinanensis]
MERFSIPLAPNANINVYDKGYKQAIHKITALRGVTNTVSKGVNVMGYADGVSKMVNILQVHIP